MYSQNNEDKIILNFFEANYGTNPYTILDIGANDGKTFSNSFYLISKGWKGTLIEPSPKAFAILTELYQGNKNVTLHNFGFGLHNGIQTLYESSGYRGGEDVALYSSIVESEVKKWSQDVEFNEVEAEFRTWMDFSNEFKDQYDFISIDCEGFDLLLLTQMNLNQLGCKVLCIEWNSNFNILEKIDKECAKYDMVMLVKNPENVIYVKK